MNVCIWRSIFLLETATWLTDPRRTFLRWNFRRHWWFSSKWRFLRNKGSISRYWWFLPTPWHNYCWQSEEKKRLDVSTSLHHGRVPREIYSRDDGSCCGADTKISLYSSHPLPYCYCVPSLLLLLCPLHICSYLNLSEEWRDKEIVREGLGWWQGGQLLKHCCCPAIVSAMETQEEYNKNFTGLKHMK